VVAIIALLISILLPSLARARELSLRLVCGTNLKGLGTSCHLYANDYDDSFPIAYYQGPTAATAQNPGIRYTANMGNAPAAAPTTTTGGAAACELEVNATSAANLKANMPASRSLFLLVIHNQVDVKQFICPSSSDTADAMRNGVGNAERAANAGTDRFDFRGYNNLSYAYQDPYNTMAPPSINPRDAQQAGMADKGPWYEFDGQYSDRAVASTLQLPFQGESNVTNILKKSNDDWRPYNSRNHNGEGQNVMYPQDSHVSFEKRPIVGAGNDNIYTRQDAYTMLATLQGQRPGNTGTDTNGPYTPTDTVLVP